MALWAALAACAAFLYQRAAATPEPMKPDELARSARQLKSDALEASFLARAMATGQLTARFARTQHQQLSQDLDGLRQALDQPPPTGREDAARRLREAGQRLRETLAEVPLHMADARAMARIAATEDGIARDAGEAMSP